MLRKKSKSLCAVLLATMLGFTALASACGNKSASSGSSFVYNLGVEPKTVDPGLNETVDGSQVICNAFEGLYRIDKNQNTVLGIADKADVSTDGKVYTFHIRSTAKWSDGKPVKADDFKYAWTRVLTPSTAASYANQLYYIKGAEDYFNGKIKADDLGIQVVNDKTLKVTLVNPTPYFKDLLTTPTYMPVRKDIVEKHKDDWTLKPETYVSDGPFKMTGYKMKDSYTFAKNPNYWDKSNVKLDNLQFKMMNDETSAFASVKNGQVDMSWNMPSVELPKALKNKQARFYPALASGYFEINLNNHAEKMDPAVKKALNNKYFRYALTYSIDSNKIAKEILQNGSKGATGYVPTGMKISKAGDKGKDFVDKKYFNPGDPTGNLAKAKDYLAKAGYKDGKGLPTLTLLYNTQDVNKQLCEAIQQMWAKIGIKVQLQNEEWAAYQNTRKAGNFQIARMSWSADYPDPMTFLDFWVTGNDGLNVGHYSNPKFDQIIKEAKAEPDKDKRSADLRKAEDIIIDDMPMIPFNFQTKVCSINPKVKGEILTKLGITYFFNVTKTK